MLAAILFGILYQGGAELAFEMPAISREMIVVIQALVILFTGALENLVRVPVERLLPAGAAGGGLMDLDTVLQLAGSSLRLATPLLLACLAGLYLRARRHLRHRPRGQDARPPPSPPAPSPRSPARPGSGFSPASPPRCALALIHGLASITLKGNQLISGVAINFLASGLTALIGQNWFGMGGQTPQLAGDAALPARSTLAASPRRSAPVPVIGPIYADLISGHNILVYVALARGAG